MEAETSNTTASLTACPFIDVSRPSYQERDAMFVADGHAPNELVDRAWNNDPDGYLPIIRSV
jgi:hypothetical protein